MKDARLARRERWATDPEHRKYLTPGLRRLLQFEVVATQIRSYQALLLPGVLPTAAMAKYIIDKAGGHLTEEQRRVNFEVRMSRRKAVIERPDGPKYYLVIDESVIQRPVGGSHVMAEQLEDLAEVASHPHVFVRVMPLEESMGATIGTLADVHATSATTPTTRSSIASVSARTTSIMIRRRSVPTGTRTKTCGSCRFPRTPPFGSSG